MRRIEVERVQRSGPFRSVYDAQFPARRWGMRRSDSWACCGFSHIAGAAFS
jgi:hypothetical protein